MALVAVVGAPAGVETVLRLGRSYPTLQFLPVPYEHMDEAPALIQACKADLFLFCGPLPYEVCRPYLDPQTPCVTLPFDGGGLVKALLALVRSMQSIPRAISVDVLKAEQVEEVVQECYLPIQTVVLPYRPGLTPEDLVRGHIELFERGETNAACTCLRSVWNELVKRGIPAVNIEPMFSSIREALHLAMLHDENRTAAMAQIAVLIISLAMPAEGAAWSYERQGLDLKVQQRLLEFGQQLEAALFPAGPGTYALFTTRGGLDRFGNWLGGMPILATLAEEVGLAPVMGIGFGMTAVDAQQNAESALEYARKSGDTCAFVVTLDKQLVGPLSATRSAVDLRVEAAALQLARRANLPPRVAGMLLQMRRSRESFTAVELATALQVTERSARRIIHQLLQSGLATASGSEQPHVKGRPRQVVQLNATAFTGDPLPDAAQTNQEKE